ncbi:MAG: hypothetical protein GX575_14260, partial [Candidatus Anammoximicrobium sp.]|nr:hypothetical protein [Candidatus Anammoximicrobium sp.]
MNLVDEGIDLGVLGSLDETALADATFSVEAGLNFGLGVYRGDLGACFANDGSTPLPRQNGAVERLGFVIPFLFLQEPRQRPVGAETGRTVQEGRVP